MSEEIATQAVKSSIVFFCRNCDELAQVTKVPGKYVFQCQKCQGKEVAFGTEKSIKNYFHIK